MKAFFLIFPDPLQAPSRQLMEALDFTFLVRLAYENMRANSVVFPFPILQLLFFIRCVLSHLIVPEQVAGVSHHYEPRVRQRLYLYGCSVRRLNCSQERSILYDIT